VGGWWLAVAAAGFWSGAVTEGLLKHRLAAPSAVLVLGLSSLPLFGLALTGTRLRHVRLSLVIVLVFATFLALGWGWTALRQARIRASPLLQLVGRQVRMQGALAEDPSEQAHGWSASFDARVVAWERLRPGTMDGSEPGLRIHDTLWLQARGPLPRLRSGDRVRVEGSVALLHGEFGRYLRNRGYTATLQADQLEFDGPPRNPLLLAANWVRSVLRRSLRRVFPAREAGLLMGLALGDTSRLDPVIEEDFRATGLSHLTAVSGENLAMFLAPVLAVVGLLRLGRVARLAVGGGSVAFFVLLTGAEPSVLRAAAMASIGMLGIFLGRPRNSAAVMGGAVLGVLVLNPTLVHSIGFQLSVAATAGMALLAWPVADRLRWLPSWLALPAGTTIAAQAGVTPLLLYQFGAVPTVTILANVLAFPAVAPGMVFGLLAGAAALLWPPVGLLFARLAGFPLRYLEALARALGRSPLPWITSPGRQVVTLAIGFSSVGAAAWWLRTGRRVPVRMYVVIGAVLFVFIWSGAVRAGSPAHLTVTFFDVGQGDAALVRSPDGAAVLIDGGPDPDLLAAKLVRLGIKRLDAVVATHPHLDHFVGLPAVLARIRVSVVFDSGCHTPENDSPPYRAFLRVLRERGIPERHPVAGDAIAVGDLRLDILSPDRCWHDTNSDPNNDSLVILLSYRGHEVLFANEPEGSAQLAMLHHSRPLRATVLNVPHHGAGTSILPFFQAVHARVAIVSVGPNRYGHPVPRTLQWLRSTGALVLRTDQIGDIVLRFEGSGLSIITDQGSIPHTIGS
jgi:competence protein ComEC